jgi:hypothetical protein
MRRREFISLLSGAAAAWPLAARAQQPTKMLRVGALSAQPRAVPIWLAFEQRIAEFGHKQGTNFTFEFVRVANVGDYEGGYRELAARKVDIMLATGPEITLKSARAAAPTVPIVRLQREQSRPTYPLSSRASLNSLSTSRPPRRLASKCQPRSYCAPTR